MPSNDFLTSSKTQLAPAEALLPRSASGRHAGLLILVLCLLSLFFALQTTHRRLRAQEQARLISISEQSRALDDSPAGP